MAIVSPTPLPGRLDPQAVHALSNHLAVILGFVELALSETSNTDPRRADLLEIRDAAMQASNILGRPVRSSDVD